MAVIYEHLSGIAAIALPPLKQVVDTPEVDAVEPILDYEGNIVQEGVPATPATYRLETPAEQIERMVGGNMLPNLPWSNWLIVADDHPAMAGGVISVGSWQDVNSVTVNAPPIFATLTDAKAAMIKWIEQLESQIIGFRSKGEVQSWPLKLPCALAVKAGNATPEQIIILQAEADLLGISVETLAEGVIAKGLPYAAIAGKISAMRDQTEKALETVTDPHDYEVVLAQAAQQAEALKAQLGL